MSVVQPKAQPTVTLAQIWSVPNEQLIRPEGTPDGFVNTCAILEARLHTARAYLKHNMLTPNDARCVKMANFEGAVMKKNKFGNLILDRTFADIMKDLYYFVMVTHVTYMQQALGHIDETIRRGCQSLILNAINSDVYLGEILDIPYLLGIKSYNFIKNQISYALDISVRYQETISHYLTTGAEDLTQNAELKAICKPLEELEAAYDEDEDVLNNRRTIEDAIREIGPTLLAKVTSMAWHHIIREDVLNILVLEQDKAVANATRPINIDLAYAMLTSTPPNTTFRPGQWWCLWKLLQLVPLGSVYRERVITWIREAQGDFMLPTPLTPDLLPSITVLDIYNIIEAYVFREPTNTWVMQVLLSYFPPSKSDDEDEPEDEEE